MNEEMRERIKRAISNPAFFESIVELEGDASTRRYFRVTLKNEEDSGETTAIMMRYPDSHLVNGELLFTHVHEYLKRGNVKVPEVYLHLPEARILFIEDAGDRTLENLAREEGFTETTLELYCLAVEEMVKVHGVCTGLLDERAHPASLALDEKKLLEEMEFLCTWGMEKVFPEKAESLKKKFLSLVEPVIEKIASFPFFLNHRDFHSRNIMVTEDGDIRILDFQDARMGPIYYDAASLLMDSYVDIPGDVQTHLVRRYREAARATDLPTGGSDDEFMQNMRITAIQRNLKALGTFFYMYLGRQKEKYLPSIPLTIGHLRSNPSFREDFHELYFFTIPLLETMWEEVSKNG